MTTTYNQDSQALTDFYNEMMVSNDQRKFTDKCELPVFITTFREIVGDIQAISDGDDSFEFTKEKYDALNTGYYMDKTVKEDAFVFVRDLKRRMLAWPRFKCDVRDLPKRVPPPIVFNVPNTQCETVDHAAGMAHHLKENEAVLSLFQDMVTGRENWTMSDLLKAMALIKKSAQRNPVGLVGTIREITPVEYALWAESTDSSVLVVGPYLAMKFAQQARALLKIQGEKLTLTRPSATIEITSNFSFVGDGEAFVKDLTYKGKALKYSPIPLQAYLLSEIFHRFKKIENAKGVLYASSYSSKDAQKARIATPAELIKDNRVQAKDGKLDVQPGVIRTVCDAIAKEFNESKFAPSEIDFVIDNLARICAKYLVQAKMDSYQNSAKALAQRKLHMYDSVFDEASQKPDPLDRIRIIQKSVATPNLKDASTMLAVEREHRNATNYMQYNYKNLASYQGNGAIPAVDTVLKGERIRCFLDKNKIVPDVTMMYGVAFGHMVDAFKWDDKYLKLYDKDPKSAAKDQVQQGNIIAIEYDYVPTDKHVLIIDDTMTEGQLGETEVIELKHKYKCDRVNKSDTGDWAKLQAFSRLRGNVTIISKISAKTIERYRSGITDLFLNEKTRRWNHVSYYKFGKLHNNEVFLVLSNARGLPKTQAKQLSISEAAIVASISVANTYLRVLADSAIHSGVIDRKEMNDIWIRLISALPCNCYWYKDVYNKEVAYGSSVVLSAESTDLFSLLLDENAWNNEVEEVEVKKPEEK